MYSDGLSSVTEREHEYAKNQRESTTMEGDTKIVCNVLHFHMF